MILNSVRHLNFDFRGARKFLSEKYHEDDESWSNWTWSIDNMEHRHFGSGQDGQGRLYHNLTNMPRELRPFASFENKSLYSVDVSASHPCILSTLYGQNCEERRRFVSMLSENTENPLYGHLNAKLTHPFNFQDENQKAEFKELVFWRIVYTSNYDKQTDLGDIFQTEFPMLAERMRGEKRRHQRDLAKAVMKTEADMILNKVALSFARKYQDKNPLLISIHDCFLTTAEYTEEIRGMMAAEYKKITGFKPATKIKTIEHKSAQDNAAICQAMHMVNPKSGAYTPLQTVRRNPVEVGDWS